MPKFNTGTRLRQKYQKNYKINQKIEKTSKNHVILYHVNGSAGKFLQMRTPAVQHKKLTKKYTTSMAVHRYEKSIL